MNALTLQQAAGLRDVNVDDIAALNFNQTAEFGAGVKVLTSGHRDIDRVSDAGHYFRISRRHRILNPHRPGRRDRLCHINGIAHIVLPVRFDGKVGVGAQFLTHRHHRFFDTPQILKRQSAGETIVAGFGVSRVGLGRNAVALELISRPAKFFGFRLLH